MFAPELSAGWRWFFLVLAIVVIALALETVSAVVDTLWRDREKPAAPLVPPDGRPRDHETLRAAAGVYPLPKVRIRIVGLDERRRPADPASVRAARDFTIGRDQYRGQRARALKQMQGERR